jgi:hypothetical protein
MLSFLNYTSFVQAMESLFTEVEPSFNPTHFPDLHNNSDIYLKTPGLRYFQADAGPGEMICSSMGTAHGAITVGDSMMTTHSFIDASSLGARASLPLLQTICNNLNQAEYQGSIVF